MIATRSVLALSMSAANARLKVVHGGLDSAEKIYLNDLVKFD
jgi:hypothetical protein